LLHQLRCSAKSAALAKHDSVMQVALGWPSEDFASAAKAALEAGSVDLASLQKLAQARRAKLPSAINSS